MVLARYHLCFNYSHVFIHFMERKFHSTTRNLSSTVQRDPLESKKEKSLTEKLKNYECMGYTQAGTEKSRQFKTKLSDFLHEIQALECEEQEQVARFLHGKFLLQLRQQRLGSHSRSWLRSCEKLTRSVPNACFETSIWYQFTTYLDSQMDKNFYEIKTERWFWCKNLITRWQTGR